MLRNTFRYYESGVNSGCIGDFCQVYRSQTRYFERKNAVSEIIREYLGRLNGRPDLEEFRHAMKTGTLKKYLVLDPRGKRFKTRFGSKCELGRLTPDSVRRMSSKSENSSCGLKVPVADNTIDLSDKIEQAGGLRDRQRILAFADDQEAFESAAPEPVQLVLEALPVSGQAPVG